MPIDNFPPAPVRGDRVSFPLVADAFVAHFEVFVPQMNAAVDEVNTAVENTTAASDLAVEAAAESQSLLGIAMWSAGTNYATGAPAISPTDYQAYRRNSPGGVNATDPAASGLWTQIHGDKVNRTGDTATDLTVDGLTIQGAVTEEVFAITGTTPAISAANGPIQTWALTANSTPTYSLNAGESVTLMIDDGTASTITWPTTRWVGSNGTAPTLAATGYNVITLWRVGADVFGTFSGAG